MLSLQILRFEVMLDEHLVQLLVLQGRESCQLLFLVVQFPQGVTLPDGLLLDSLDLLLLLPGKQNRDTVIIATEHSDGILYTVNSLMFARDLFGAFRDRFKIASLNTRKHNSCVPR